MSSPIKSSIKLVIKRPPSDASTSNPPEEPKIKDAVFGNKSLKSNKLVNTVPTEPSISLRNLVNETCANTSQLMCTSLEHLPRLAIHDAKETLIKTLITSRSTLQKLQLICEWSNFAHESHALLGALDEKDPGMGMIEAADKLAVWYQSIQQAPLPIFDIQMGIRAFLGVTESGLSRDPETTPSGFNQNRWIAQLNDLIRLRLVQHRIPFVSVERGEGTLNLHSINIRITIVPEDNWFVTGADSNALCSLLQTHFNYMPTLDDTFHTKLQSLMDEYLKLWILDRFSTEAARMALVVRQRDKYLEIVYNIDSSIRLDKESLSLSVSIIDKVIDIPFIASFDVDSKTILEVSLSTISTHLYSLLASTLTPFDFAQYTDYMTFFKNEHSIVYYDLSKGLVMFIPLLDDSEEFKFDNFSCPLSQRGNLINVLEEYQTLLEDRSLYHSLQHNGVKVTKQKLLLGIFSSFYIYTRHPNCIINYFNRAYTLHYYYPDQSTSRNTLRLEHPNSIDAALFLERFVLDSELRGRVDHNMNTDDASAEITSIAHLSGVRSITFSCLDGFRFEANFQIRERFKDVPLESSFESGRIDALLDWSYKQVALLALVQQARLLEKPVQLLSENLVRIGEKEFVVSDRLECIIELT